jgi:porphobilinogen deaminase
MIKGEVDIAVHSMKDVPTALPKGIVQAAVLQRADTHDILVHKGNDGFLPMLPPLPPVAFAARHNGCTVILTIPLPTFGAT